MAVFAQHLDPARDVFGHTQCLVVNAPNLVVGSAFQHGVDDSQHFVRQRGDGFLVALADGQRIELGL